MFESICGYYGVEVGTYPDVNNDKEIYFYDNTITGKQYIMYLAELFGGNAKIERDGSCSIIPLNNIANITIDALTSKKFELGDTYELSRICYDNGVVKYQAGGNVISVNELPTEDIDEGAYYYLTSDMKYYKYVVVENEYEWQVTNDIKNTLYLRNDNIFINQQGDIDAIAYALQGFSITNITCENRMDLSLDCWDIVTYSVGNNTYNTFYDNTINFNGVAMGTVKVNIPLKITEETTNIITNNTDEKNRYLKTLIDQVNNTLTTTISEVGDEVSRTNSRIDTVEGSIQNIYDFDELNERLATIENNINGMEVSLNTKGGNNLFYYAKEFWSDGTVDANNQPNPANLIEYTDTELKQLAIGQKGYIINSGDSEQKVSVKNNEDYTISFRYKLLEPLATVTLDINGNTYELTETEWTDFTETLNITTNTIDFKITSDTNNALEIYDLLANLGVEKEVWTQNPNETNTETVSIGKGIQVNSTITNTYTRIDADGNRIYNINTGNIVTEMTDKGINTDNISAKR